MDKDAPFALIEIFENSSFEEWEQDCKTQVIKDVVDQWPNFGDLSSLKAYKCEDFPLD